MSVSKWVMLLIVTSLVSVLAWVVLRKVFPDTRIVNCTYSVQNMDLRGLDLKELEKLDFIFRTEGSNHRWGQALSEFYMPIRDAAGYFTVLPMMVEQPMTITAMAVSVNENNGGPYNNIVYWGKRGDTDQIYFVKLKPGNNESYYITLDPISFFEKVRNDTRGRLYDIVVKESGVKEFKLDRTHRPSMWAYVPVDTWGTPIMQYRMAMNSADTSGYESEQYEYRSAGPDRIFYTNDDIVVSKNMPPHGPVKRVKDLSFFQLPIEERQRIVDALPDESADR